MPKSINKVNYAGHLGGDPVVRTTGGGQKVANLRIPASRSFKKKGEEEWQEETCWMNVTVWGRDAEKCEERLHKGDYVQVFGRLQSRDYEKDGQKRTSIDIIADEVIFPAQSKGERGSDSTSKHYEEPAEEDDNVPF